MNVATVPVDLQEFSEVLWAIASVKLHPFDSLVVKGRCNTVFTSGRLQVVTHALGKNDGCPSLGLEAMNTYVVLKQGSKSIPVVLKNLTGQPITTKKGIKIVQ